ncbi:hypothetical protein EV189_4044 [Motilibacter rhizosphaerae]|uniref:Uncharacterized protein n=1 Tax=Motilibacter rhizosphaerae TaxID=598652 RepID=A0A4Q7N735_9ACTN|nr:hypothetical protein EV189_4044 [Motilibacter rhizosphaerae]
MLARLGLRGRTSAHAALRSLFDAYARGVPITIGVLLCVAGVMVVTRHLRRPIPGVRTTTAIGSVVFLAGCCVIVTDIATGRLF